MSIFNRPTEDPNHSYFQYMSMYYEGNRFLYDPKDPLQKKLAYLKASEERTYFRRRQYTEYQAHYYQTRKDRIRETRLRRQFRINGRTGELMKPRYLREREKKKQIKIEKQRKIVKHLNSIVLTEEDLIIDFDSYNYSN